MKALHFPFAAILAALALPVASHAATRAWNNAAGGDFNTAGNWTGGIPVATDVGLFNIALSGNVTLSANAIPGSLNFDTSASTFSLGTLLGNTITTANTGNLSVLSTLSGAGKTFTVNAPLILTPASASTAGAYTIQNNATDASNTLIIAGGITSGTTSNTETLTLAGSNAGNNTISGVIGNGSATTFAVTKSGAGTWILSNANTYNGLTTVSAGTLSLAHVGGTIADTAAVTVSAGTLDVAQSDTVGAVVLSGGAISGSGILTSNTSFSVSLGTISAALAGSAALNKTNSGTTVTLSGDNSYSGGTAVVGTLIAGHKNALGTGTVTLGGTLQANADLSGANALGNNFVSGAATFSGSNNLTLAGSFTNTTTGSAMTSSLSSGKTLVFAGNVYISDVSGTGKNLTFAGTGNTTISGAISNFNGSGTAGALTISNTGATLLTGINTYTGATTVNSGILQISGSSGANTGTGGYTLNGGSMVLDNTTAAGGNNNNRIADASTIKLSGGAFIYKGSDAGNSTETVGVITAGSGGAWTLTYGGTNTATLTGASFNHTVAVSTVLVNGLALGKDSASTASVSRFILTGAPTLTGTTNATATGINSGSQNTKIVPWFVGEATQTSGGVGTSTGTANTFLTYNATTGLRPLNPTDEFTNNAIISANNTYITSATAASSTVAINSLVINGGDLSISDGQTLTNTSGALLFASTNAIKPGGTTGAYTALSGTTENQITVNSGITGTISTAMTGTTSALTKSGAGTLVLSGANTYNGTTTVNAGTLILTGSNSSAGATTINPGNTLILGGTSNGGLASGLLSLAGSTVIQAQTQAATLTNAITMASTNNTFSGSQNISTSGNVTFTQQTATAMTNNISGTLTLGSTGSNFYLAATATGQGRTIAGTGNTIIAGNIKDSSVASTASTLTITNTGVTTLSGTNTYTGATTVNNGILTFLNTNAKASATVTAAAAGTIGLGVASSGSFYSSANVASLFNSTLTGFALNAASGVAIDTTAGDFTQSDALTAARALTKLGANKLTLSVANTYTGATVINAGTLAVSATGSIAGGSAVAVNNGGTLAGTGNVAGTVTVNNGGTLSPGNSPGLQTVGSLVLNNGGNYNWQVLNAAGAAGTGYDSYTLTGVLDLSNLTGATNFNINLWSLASISPDVNGDAAGFNNAVNQSWTLVATNSAITGFNQSFFTVNVAASNGTAGFSNALAGGTFSVALGDGGTDLMLSYTAVPEPATWALLAGAGTFLMVMRRRE